MSSKSPVRKPLAARRAFVPAILLLTIVLLPGCFIHRHKQAGLPVAPGEQPDKILLQKSLNEIKHGRYQQGRLLLQALINTYPDSEYLSQAKLATANSYYKEGGISGLTEAEAEYKDFITFFPTAPEAPMSEYRAGMCFFRLIGKADRDATEAQEAEVEFKVFLQNYPTNPLMPKVKARLREVQEVLAQGEFEIAEYYYIHRAYLASASRFKGIANRYPNFSKGDEVFWDLCQSLTQLQKPREAVPYYDQLIMEFPLSPRVKQAKDRLASLHEPIPQPTKAMLARAEADAVRRDKRSLLAKALSGLSSGPDFTPTLRGPVVLGTQDQIQAKIAKLDKPLPASVSPTPGNHSVTVQPESDSSLKSGKAGDPASPNPSAPGAAASKSSAKAQQNVSTSEGDSTSPTVPKKKGKFHFLKKLIP